MEKKAVEIHLRLVPDSDAKMMLRTSGWYIISRDEVEGIMLPPDSSL